MLAQGGTDDLFDAGRDAFAVGVCELSTLDWLHLAQAGHTRAQFEWTGADWTGRWVTP